MNGYIRGSCFVAYESPTEIIWYHVSLKQATECDDIGMWSVTKLVLFQHLLRRRSFRHSCMSKYKPIAWSVLGTETCELPLTPTSSTFQIDNTKINTQHLTLHSVFCLLLNVYGCTKRTNSQSYTPRWYKWKPLWARFVFPSPLPSHRCPDLPLAPLTARFPAAPWIQYGECWIVHR